MLLAVYNYRHFFYLRSLVESFICKSKENITRLIFNNVNPNDWIVVLLSSITEMLVGFLCVFSVRHLSVLRGHSVFSSPPQQPMTSDFEGFLYQILSITSFSYFNSLERASISLFNGEC